MKIKPKQLQHGWGGGWESAQEKMGIKGLEEPRGFYKMLEGVYKSLILVCTSPVYEHFMPLSYFKSV